MSRRADRRPAAARRAVEPDGDRSGHADAGRPDRRSAHRRGTDPHRRRTASAPGRDRRRCLDKGHEPAHPPSPHRPRRGPRRSRCPSRAARPGRSTGSSIEHVEIADVAGLRGHQARRPGRRPRPQAPLSRRRGVLTDTTYILDDADISDLDGHHRHRRRHRHLLRRRRRRSTDATALRSAFAQNQFGENIIENTSDIAADNDAVFAINGDYYGFRDTGIVIRNGVVYRDEGARAGSRVLPRRHRRGLRRDRDHRRRARRRRRLEHAVVRAGAAGGRRRSSTASTTSRSTRTSATTRSRASSRAPRSA